MNASGHFLVLMLQNCMPATLSLVFIFWENQDMFLLITEERYPGLSLLAIPELLCWKMSLHDCRAL